MATEHDETIFDMPPGVPPEVARQMEEMSKEMNAAIETIRSEHGEKFTQAVRALLAVRQMQMILQMTGAPDTLQLLLSHLMGGLLKGTLDALGQSERLKEIEFHAQTLVERLGNLHMPEPDSGTKH